MRSILHFSHEKILQTKNHKPTSLASLASPAAQPNWWEEEVDRLGNFAEVKAERSLISNALD
jgi:hypothetical protein